MGIFTKTAGYFKDRLGKTRNKISSSLSSVLSLGRNIDEGLSDELEETLISDDIGVATTDKLVSELREAYRKKQIDQTDDLIPFTKSTLKAIGPIATGNCIWLSPARPLSLSPVSMAQAKPQVLLNLHIY